MLDSIFRISQLTLPVATVLGSAWLVVSGYGENAFYLFIGGFIFTLILRVLEQQIFEINYDSHRFLHKGYTIPH